MEGDSAGGSAKQGRSRKFQAILPLRGKILNVEKARIDRMLGNNEVKSLIIAMGTNIAEQFEIEKLRYHKIIIMTDADVDGAHISTLLLTLFYRHFKPLIEAGYVYLAQPPLFRVQKGKEVTWMYSEEELEDFKKKHKLDINTDEITESGEETDEGTKEEVVAKDAASGKLKGFSIQRYKGLGEMNPDQLWDTTMDPATRVLKRINIEDGEKADETFNVLMGADVPPRKKFIQTHAKNVKNLDI